MRKQKVITIVLASGMLIACFSGCGFEKVTAEDLVNNACNMDAIESLDADIALVMDIDVDATSLFTPYNADEDSDSDSDSKSSTKMNITLDADCNAKAANDLAYISGNVEAGFFGMTYNVKVENYTDAKNGVSYSYDSDSDVWVKSDLEDDSDSLDLETLKQYTSSDIFENLVLVNEKDKKAETYEVTGTISYDSIADLLGDKVDDMFSGFDPKGMTLDATMNFDRKTKQLETMKVSVDPDSMNSDVLDINEFSITVTINSLKDVKLEIPKDVKDNAIEEGSSTIDDDDFLIDDMEVYPEWSETEDDEFGMEDSESEAAESENQTSQSTDDQTLAQFYFETDDLSFSDVKEILSAYYNQIGDMDPQAIASFATFMNNYTFDTFDATLDTYEDWASEDKIALAIMYDIGIVDDELLSEHNVSLDSVKSYIGIYVSPYES